MVPGAGDEAYINPLPEQGPVVDQFFTVANIRGPRHDSDSNQSMYVVHGGLTVSGSWEFGDNGTGTSVIYLANDAEVSVNGEMRHRQGGAELYISDSVVFTCSDWLRLADSGSALVDINGEPNVMIAGDLRGASNSGAWFEAYIGGGQVSVGGDLKIGDYGGGLIDISGGEVSCGHLRLVAGAAGTTADLNVGDGELYVANSTTVCEGSGIASLNMSAGDVNTGHLLIGGDGGVGSVDMSGGTLVVRSVLRVPASPGGTATVDLDGGTILCGSFESAGAYTMELNQGVLVIDGNVIEAILADVNAGYITAHPDKNDVVVDYNGVRTGRTTVWSVPHLKIVPDVVSEERAEAELAITDIFLVVGTVVEEYNDIVAAGEVIRQNPAVGTAVAFGSVVDLVVSLGQPNVPNVVGMTSTDAIDAVTAVDDLTVAAVSWTYDNAVPAGLVISQDPLGGTAVPIGSAVDLVVSLGKPLVPDVVGMPEPNAAIAIELIDNLGVGTVSQAYHDTVPAGSVISQEPLAGTLVPIGSSVDLVVSLGRPIVPNVVGMTQGAATSLIEAVSLTVGTVNLEYSDTIAAGIVIIQHPVGGTPALVGYGVTLTVSLGKPVVPMVVGQSLADATLAIEGIDELTVGSVTEVYDDAVPAGVVISQDPVGGTVVLIGSTVDLVVSLGRPIVPDVVGQTEAAAIVAIEAVDDLTALVTREYHNTVPLGDVASQDPAPGTAVNIGSIVNIVVSLGRPVVPDVVGLDEADAVSQIDAIEGLTAAVARQYHNTVPAGIVISQEPAGGTDVDVGTTVDIVVSSGRPVVPNVVGMDAADANTAIEAIDDLTAAVTYQYHNTAAVGTVSSQDPVGGSEVDVASTVAIVVSLGRPVVPDVVGLTQTAAVVAIGAIDDLVPVLSYAYDNTAPAGEVISQDPVAETPVDIGSTVTVVVSLGRPVVPNVVGHSELDAVTAIEAVDHLVVSSIHEHDNSVPPGIVISQNPMAGMEVEVGSTVTIVISMGRPVVPNVVGLSEAAAILAVESIDSLVVSVVYAHHDTVAAGVVIGQDPTGGATVNVGTIVTIGVSLGRPFVPDVVGMSQAEAAIAIGVIDGLSVSAQFEYDGAVPEGIVIDQDPAAGTVMDVGSTVTIVVSLGPTTFMVLGGVRLVELQNADGGWDEPLDDGDPEDGSEPYRFTSVALGLILSQRLNRQSNNSELTAAIERAGSFLISKVYTFAPGDGLLAVELDRVLGGTEYTSYVRSNFYDQLSAGTYADARSGVFDCNTAKYIQAQRDRLTGSSANFAAWELGLGLYSAYVMEQDTSEWVAGVKAEIDELNVFGSNDVLGLAGAVLGLAVVGEEYDPQAGEHAGASDLSDLAAILSGYQLGTGGFTWHAGFVVEGWDESVRETAYGLMALNEFDRAGYLSVINAAGEYLESVQLASNGWEHFFGGEEDNEATGEALMGAVSAHALAGDFNNDGNEDLGDFSVFASAWMSEVGDSNYKSICDMAKPTDGIVDGQDLAVLGGLWLQGAE
jgi:beta-lactam-binding protein with PASTA domain